MRLLPVLSIALLCCSCKDREWPVAESSDINVAILGFTLTNTPIIVSPTEHSRGPHDDEKFIYKYDGKMSIGNKTANVSLNGYEPYVMADIGGTMYCVARSYASKYSFSFYVMRDGFFQSASRIPLDLCSVIFTLDTDEYYYRISLIDAMINTKQYSDLTVAFKKMMSNDPRFLFPGVGAVYPAASTFLLRSSAIVEMSTLAPFVASQLSKSTENDDVQTIQSMIHFIFKEDPALCSKTVNELVKKSGMAQTNDPTTCIPFENNRHISIDARAHALCNLATELASSTTSTKHNK